MSTTKRIFRAVRRGYRSMFQRQEDAHLRAVVETLRRVPVFQHFSRGILRDLAEVLHARAYKRDEFLYYEGDPGLGLYIVQHGRIRLMTEDEEGHVHELRQVGEYELVGEVAILGDFRRLETAQAISETEVLGFFSPDMKIMAKRNPKTSAAVTAALARYLAARQVEMVRVVAESAGKVAAMRLRDDAAIRTNDPAHEAQGAMV